MVRLTCPRCSTTFEPTPGVTPQCPSCGYSPGAPQPGPAPMAPPAYADQPPMTPPMSAPPMAQPMAGTNGMATGALVCGLLGLCFAPLAIVAIILGFSAKSQIKQTGQQGDGMATAGIILGFVIVGVTIVFIMFYAFVFAALTP